MLLGIVMFFPLLLCELVKLARLIWLIPALIMSLLSLFFPRIKHVYSECMNRVSHFCVCCRLCAQKYLGSFVFSRKVLWWGSSRQIRDLDRWCATWNTFDSTQVFVRQRTAAFHPACQPLNRARGKTVLIAFVSFFFFFNWGCFFPQIRSIA